MRNYSTDIVVCATTALYTSAEQMSMGLPQRQRLWKKDLLLKSVYFNLTTQSFISFHDRRYAKNIILNILLFTSGSILTLTILAAQAHRNKLSKAKSFHRQSLMLLAPTCTLLVKKMVTKHAGTTCNHLCCGNQFYS